MYSFVLRRVPFTSRRICRCTSSLVCQSMTACPGQHFLDFQRNVSHAGIHVNDVGSGSLLGLPHLLVTAGRSLQDFVDGQGHRRQAVPGGDAGLAMDILLQVGHLPVSLGGVDQLGAHLLDDAGEALGQALVECGILRQPLVYLRADGVLHDRGTGLGVGQVGYLLVEILVEDGDRLHHLADFGADALVDELLDLGADVRPVDVGVLAEEVGADVGPDQGEPGQPVDIRQTPRVG